MPIKVDDFGSDLWYEVSEGAGCEFHLMHESGRTIDVDIPLKLDNSFKDKEFDIHFLVKKNVKESEIYQVYCRDWDRRIGWIIPAISLSSCLHDYSNNEHFLKYAYMGVRESLRKIDTNIFTYCISGEKEEVRYSSIFHEETVLLVLSKETWASDFEFNIDRMSPSLIKHGYVALSSRNPEEIHYEAKVNISEKLYLEQVSDEVNGCSLIGELLNSSFSYETKAVFRFFYLYQIIELLIDCVYKNEQEALVDELVNAKGDSGKTKDVIDKIQKFMSEKKRLSLLVNNYSNVGSELNELKQLCNLLLDDLNRDRSDSFEGYFYKIRNFIFHQYRDFPSESEEKLDEVITEVVNLIPSLLNKFKLPY